MRKPEIEPLLPWWREISTTFMLAFPVMVGNFSQMLIGVSDTVMIGRLGVEPLATATFANNLVSIFFLCAIGFFTSVSIRTSQLRGAGALHIIPQSLFHALALSLLAGLIISVFLYNLIPWLAYFGQPVEVVQAAPVYLTLVAFSMIPAIPILVLKNFAEAFERPWGPLVITIAGAVLNVLLNYVLIYGKLGFPRLELEGAGLATLIARIVTLALFIFWLWGHSYFKQFLPTREHIKIAWGEVLFYIRLGFPPGLQLLAEVGAFGGSTFMMGWLGEIEMASHQIALTTIGTIYMIPLGLAISGTIRIGKAYGAQSWNRLRPLGFSVMVPGFVFTIICTLFLWLGGESIAGWFIHDEQVIAMTASLFVIASLFLIADGFQVIFIGCLRGLSDVRTPMISGIISYLGIALPLGYYFAFVREKGAIGIWMGLAIAITLVAIAMTLRFFVKVKKFEITNPTVKV